MNIPKFKEGDWIKSKKSGTIARVNLLLKECYDIETIDKDFRWLDYEHQDNWELTDEPHIVLADLEEAANNYASVTDPEAHGIDFIREVFIAGAEWREDTKSSSSETPSDLEEAAEAFAFKSLDEVILYGCTLSGRRACFIAGAKWQEEQDQETIELAEDHAYLAGAVNEREKMLKEAVEGHITNAGGELGYDVAAFRFDENHTYTVLLPHEEGRKHGDKVRIIIVKEDEK